MPQFRFLVSGQGGKLRTGKLTATNLADATQRLKSLGLEILELSESYETIQVHKLGFSGRVIERAERYIVSQSRIALWLERLPPKTGYTIAGCLACMGLCWGLATWRIHQAKKQAYRARTATEMSQSNRVSFKLKGAIQSYNGGDFRQQSLVLNFPEIPQRFYFRWEDLEHPRENEYLKDIEFLSNRQPTYFELSLTPGNPQTPAKKFLLESDGSAPATALNY